MTTRSLLVFTLLGLAGCQCGSRVMGSDSKLLVAPGSVEFGTLLPLEVGTHDLVVSVSGRLPINVSGVRIEQSDRAPFSTTATIGSIEPGGERRFTVSYLAPNAPGLDEGTLVFTTDPAGLEVRVPLQGRAAAGECQPRTCAGSCGEISDGCAGMISCPACCVPQTCTSRGASCGSTSDGCGGTLSCGTCGPGTSCNQNQCSCTAVGTEACGDGVDNDCDGAVDCADSECSATTACMQPACTITDAEVQVTQSAFGAYSGYLAWTGTGYGLFVHEDLGNTNMRFAYQRLDAQAQPVGGLSAVSGTGAAHRPFAAWTGTGFGLAWSDLRNTLQQNDVYFTSISPTGQRLLTNDVGISAQPGLAFPSSIAWNPTANEFGVLWGDDRSAGPGNDRSLYFRRVDLAGNLSGAEVRLTPSPAGVTTDYSDLTWGGSNWGIVATQFRNGNPFMLFNRLSSTGAPELTDLQLNAAGKGGWMPRIAASPTHYAAVFAEGSMTTDVVATLIEKSGPANPVRVVLTSSGSAGNPTVVWTGASWAVVYQDNRTGVRRLYLARLGADGSRLGADALLSCVTGAALLPHVAFDGTRVAVTFSSTVAGVYQSFVKRFDP